MQMAGTLSNSVQVARQVGRDVLSCLQVRTISYHDFVVEVERMVELAGFLGLGTGRYMCVCHIAILASDEFDAAGDNSMSTVSE